MLHPQPGSLRPVVVHLDRPSVARVYNYFLGGTINWEVDRTFGDQILDKFPLMRRIAFAHRLFLNRTVHHLAGQGVRQFLDVGSGVPSAGATHDVADEWAIRRHRRPDTRVVYVDNDPVAVAHTELLLDRDGDRRRHAVIDADLREPEVLWRRALSSELLDPSKPIALLLIGVLHLQQLDADGNEMGPESVGKLQELLPLGSFVALSHVTDEGVSADVRATLTGLKQVYDESGSCGVTWRRRTEIQEMLSDLRMIEPGWTAATEWHPEDTGPNAPIVFFPPSSCGVIWAGVGRKG